MYGFHAKQYFIRRPPRPFCNFAKVHILTNAVVIFQWLALFFDPNKLYTPTLLVSNVANYALVLCNGLETQNIVTRPFMTNFTFIDQGCLPFTKDFRKLYFSLHSFLFSRKFSRGTNKRVLFNLQTNRNFRRLNFRIQSHEPLLPQIPNLALYSVIAPF